MKLIKPDTDQIDFSSQPRSGDDQEQSRGLSESMKTIGQQVPIIGYTDPQTGRFKAYDGGRRLAAAKLAGLPHLLAIDLGKEPAPADLVMAQAAIDIHKQHLPRLDRARLWQANIKARGCTARQLAKELGVSESLVGDYLALLTLPSDVQEMVNRDALNMSKACLIAQQESDPDRQRELAKQAVDISRVELATRLKKARSNTEQKPAVSAKKIKIELASATVTISGANLTLDAAIDAVLEAHKEMKRGRQQGLTARTIQEVTSDRAKAAE